ncbi:MAG: adenylyltransferase [Chloroflexi bacterium RBG_13_54_8]|nr:MAG: adenylyltransferase [Chloroflexi bacterium RBG_13_54_8]
MLSQQELARYERQIMMPDWGEAGQEKLKQAKIMVAGAGGLGSAVLTYLTVAGVGRIRIIDGDRVDLSNLNRQTLHSDKDIGRKKVDSAKERLEALNEDIRIEAVGQMITEENVLDLVADFPIVDALDNLAARLLLNRVALRRNLPLFHGAVCGFEGRATTMIPGQTPCLRCLYQGVLPGRIPVVGVTPAVIGCVQATEVIKYIIGIGELLTSRLLIYDGLSLRFSETKLRKDPDCAECQSTQ